MHAPNIAPYQQAEIIAETETAWQAVSDFVTPLSPEDFHAKPSPHIWSAAENLEHLFIATKPLVKALGVPKIALRSFGKPNRSPRSYSEVAERYQSRLATLDGPIDQKQFAPQVSPDSGIAEHLETWQSIGKKYCSRISDWKDQDLDAYLLPHPLMGKVVLREMLFFTIYHTYHHLRIMKERTGRA